MKKRNIIMSDMKKVIITTMFASGLPISCYAQGLGIPELSTLEKNHANEGVITTEVPEYNPDDFLPPSDGEIRLAELNQINAIQKKISELLEESPNKDAEWIVTATQISNQLSALNQSKNREQFLKLASLVKESSQEVSKIIGEEGALETKYSTVLEGLSIHFHNESFNFIEKNDAVLSDEQWLTVKELVVYQLLATERLSELLPNYVCSSGGFITSCDRALADLKVRPLKDIEAFLGGVRDTSFFSRYEAGGDGMDILKEKYTSNKTVIQAKFAELIEHVEELEK